MEFDLDLDAFWPLDPIHFPSNPMSPPLFSSTDQPCSPLWGFPDGDADNDDKLAGQVEQALSDRPQFSSCIPDPGREIPTENEDRRMLTSPFLGLELVENPNAFCLIKGKITQALRLLMKVIDKHVLAQFWAPVKNGGRYVLTTSGQPFVLDPHTNGLHQYRMASLMYMFSVDGESDGMLGLPGRVFQQKLPEWTPNVQYYSIKEYPQLGHAQHYNVQGTLALPVFHPSGRSCVGVLELIMTSPNISYASEVDKVRKALEAVSLRSSEILDHTSMQPEQNNFTPSHDTRTESVLDTTKQFTTDEIFNSRKALLNWSRVQGRKCGIVVVIKRSDGAGKIITRRARVTLGCERGGHYIKNSTVDSDDEQPMNSKANVSIDHWKKKRPKSTGTKKCGCPFQLKGLNIGPGDEWKVEVVCGVHNHHSAEYLEGHSYAGRLSKEENNLLMDMSKILVRPKDILYTIKRQDGKNVTTTKTISNARHKSRVVEKASTSEMQLLLCRLSDHKYIHWHRTDDTNCVSDLFWAHPDSVNLLHAFPHVLVMDCTYKTNRFRYPLLQIVGVTSTKLTFSAAFAYISSEKEDNYMWALNRLKSIMNTNCLPGVILTGREIALMNAIRNVFPSVQHLLCRWHINRCVMKACKGILKGEKWEQFIVLWNMLVLAKTEVDYERNLLEMDRIFEGKYSKALDYVKVNWLKEYKDKFVAVWTDTCMHFGNTTSNRAESAHSQLKRQLGTGQCNFETSWAKIHVMLVLQHTEIKASFEKSQSFVQHEFNRVSLLKDLIGYVSIVALEEILCESKRIQYVGTDPIACGCVIRRSHGLPCAHEMAELSRVFRPIPLHCVHPHWRKLDMFPAAQINDNLDSPEDAKIDVFVNWFKSNDPDTKRHIGMKLQEIMDSKSSTLREPQVKIKTKGRPSNFDKSTCRLPSAFELVESDCNRNSRTLFDGIVYTKPPPKKRKKQTPPLTVNHDTQSSAHAIVNIETTLPKKQPPKLPVHKQQIVNPEDLTQQYNEKLPAAIRPFIIGAKDVKSDGNCGFRAIAGLLGYGENSWRKVRRELLNELKNNEFLYEFIFQSVESKREVEYRLDYFDDYPLEDRWMLIPEMGYLIANCYNVVLMHFSNAISLMFLPTESHPLPEYQRREISIGLVEKHFVQLHLQPHHPMPPVINRWLDISNLKAFDWYSPYRDRIDNWKELTGSFEIQICNEGRQTALTEILEILTVVCETHKLPLAQTWVPCMHRNVLAYGGGLKKSCTSFDGSCMEQVCMSTTDAAFYIVDAPMWHFREACVEHHLQKGQGVAGRAFLSRNACFCRDITQFCKTDYPLVHYTRMFKLTSCFAICLQSTRTGNDDYILEFFLPPSITDSYEQRTLLGSLLAIIKNHFQSLKVASGIILEEEGLVEMVQASTNKGLDSRLECIRIPR